jgi:type II secretory pathway pseudopilin PulG
MTNAGLVNLVTVLGITVIVLVIALVVLAVVLAEQVGARRAVERRSARLTRRLAEANTRIRRLLKLDEPAATLHMPRIEAAPKFRTGTVRPPSTALVPAGERSLERVR